MELIFQTKQIPLNFSAGNSSSPSTSCDTFGFAANFSRNCWNWFSMSSKTGLILPPSPWESIQFCHWKSGISWACYQSLSALMNWFLISSKTWLISPPFLLGLIRTCRWRAGIGWAQSIAWANKRCNLLWQSSFWSVKLLLEGLTSLWKFCWPDLRIKGLLLEKSWDF